MTSHEMKQELPGLPAYVSQPIDTGSYQPQPVSYRPMPTAPSEVEHHDPPPPRHGYDDDTDDEKASDEDGIMGPGEIPDKALNVCRLTVG